MRQHAASHATNFQPLLTTPWSPSFPWVLILANSNLARGPEPNTSSLQYPVHPTESLRLCSLVLAGLMVYVERFRNTYLFFALVSQSKVEEKPSSQNLFDEQLPDAAAPKI